AFTEQDKDCIKGRKLMFEAQRAYRAADPTLAIRKYEEAFAIWKGVFERFPDFRADSFTQEETYETQIKYTNVLVEHRGATLWPALVVADVLAQGAAGGFPGQAAFGTLYEAVRDLRALPLPVM